MIYGGGAGVAVLLALILLVWSPWKGSAVESEPVPQPQPVQAASIPSTESSSGESITPPLVASPSSNPPAGPMSQAEQDELYSRAEQLAAANRGVEASEIFRRLIEVKHQGAWGWQRLTILDLQGNNLEKHRQDCETMLRLFGNTNDPAEAERVVKVCVLSPKPVELAQASALAERLLVPDRSEFAYWSKTVLGLVAIRKAAYEEAIAYLNEADSLNTTNQTQARCLNQAALSIVYSRKKQPNLARKAFDEAMKIKSDETERGDRTEYAGEWHNWYTCAIALKEAETLLKFPPK
jgi:tetratricopeptide (TPR) repeat protein